MIVEYESNLIIPMLIFAFIVFVIPSYILIKKAVKEDEQEKNSFVQNHHVRNTIIGLAVYILLIVAILAFGIYDNQKRAQYQADIRSAINSSGCFSRIDFDVSESTLTVTFKDSDHSYRYYEFSKKDFDEFIFSDSLGDYYNRHIKGEYPVLRID